MANKDIKVPQRVIKKLANTIYKEDSNPEIIASLMESVGKEYQKTEKELKRLARKYQKEGGANILTRSKVRPAAQRLKGHVKDVELLADYGSKAGRAKSFNTPSRLGRKSGGGIVGNQSKLDVDGSGDITGKDLAALRAGHRGRAAKSSMEKS